MRNEIHRIPVTITRSGVVSHATPQEMDEARAAFARYHCLLMPQFLEPALLRVVQEGIDRGQFYARTHEGIGTERCLASDKTSALLEFVANDPALFRLIRQITGCEPIGCFQGRVYQMLSAAGHYDSWHSDLGEDRLLAMSINLTPQPYQGGELQIRDQRTRQIVHEAANVGYGDAILFRIAPHLRHRVTAVGGCVERTAYAGWFRTQPAYEELLAAERLSSQSGLSGWSPRSSSREAEASP